MRISQSLDLDQSHITKALATFTTSRLFNASKSANEQEPSPKEASQVSQMSYSAPNINSNKQGIKMKRDRP